MKRQTSQTRPPRRRRPPDEKAAILRDHGSSGLSLLAFAGQHGLCYSSLVRWRCRAGKGAGPVVAPGAQDDPGFVPVKIQEPVLMGDYVLSWPGGRSLRIPPGFEVDSLRRLLSVLEGVR